MMLSARERGGVAGLEPLHRVEGDLQRQIEQCRKADDGEAGHDGQVEFEALRHDEDGRELPKRREPAQTQDRVEPDTPFGMAKLGSSRDVGHDSGDLAMIRKSGCRFSEEIMPDLKRDGDHHRVRYADHKLPSRRRAEVAPAGVMAQ